MLVLTRRIGETIVIANTIRVSVVAVKEHQVRLGITAPSSVRVDRQPRDKGTARACEAELPEVKKANDA